MNPRTFGLAFLGLALCAFVIQIEGRAQDKKDVKDAKKEVGKDKETGKDNYEIPKDAYACKVKAVDLKASTFTATMKNGKDRTFGVDKETEFYGPRGGKRGTGPDGLKDDCMEKGYEIHVLPSKDGKIAKEVHLPLRKTDKDEKDKG